MFFSRHKVITLTQATAHMLAQCLIWIDNVHLEMPNNITCHIVGVYSILFFFAIWHLLVENVATCSIWLINSDSCE